MDNKNKFFTQAILSISSAIIIYIFALYVYKSGTSLNILLLIVLLFILYLISYAVIPALASVINTMFRYDTTDERKEYIIFITPFLISILIFILRLF